MNFHARLFSKFVQINSGRIELSNGMVIGKAFAIGLIHNFEHFHLAEIKQSAQIVFRQIIGKQVK
jgi:hypothetical protein